MELTSPVSLFIAGLFQFGARTEAQHANHLCGEFRPFVRPHAQPSASPAAGSQTDRFLHRVLEAQRRHQASLGDGVRLQEADQQRRMLLVSCTFNSHLVWWGKYKSMNSSVRASIQICWRWHSEHNYWSLTPEWKQVESLIDKYVQNHIITKYSLSKK